MQQQDIDHVLNAYALGRVYTVKPILEGLVNRNFFIEAEGGNYVLQQMAGVFDERTIEDMEKVTSHLHKKNVPAPELIHTTENACCFRDADGRLWKMMRAIDGFTYHILETPELAYEAAKKLGEFINGLRDFDGAQLENPLRLHQTQNIIADFEAIYEQLIAKEENTEYRAAYEYIHTQLPLVLLPENLPQSVVHGDPKISNIIFKEGRAVCMIDIDTCMVHTPLVDIGDALRSWCGLHEDNPENVFNTEIYEHAMRGFDETLPLSAEERGLVIQATRMITLELAARFATDVINDNYFGWNNQRYDSRRAHNAARALGQVQLDRSIVSQFS